MTLFAALNLIADTEDRSFFAWWMVILILGFATIGLCTAAQIMCVVFRKQKPAPAINWPADRVCLLLRLPALGTPGYGDTPPKGGTMRVDVTLTETRTDGTSCILRAKSTITGATNLPYLRMYSWDSHTGDLAGEEINFTT